MATAPGIRERHSRNCKSRDGGRCNCSPSIEAFVFSKRDNRKIRKTFTGKGARAEAKNWRTDALKAVKDKKLRAPTHKTLQQEWDEWLAGARAGDIRKRNGEEYKPAVLREYDRAMRLRVLPELGRRRASDIDREHLLDLKELLLGGRLQDQTVANTFRPLQALYRRLQDRGIPTNPTRDLSLPSGYKQRERIATPEEAAELIAALPERERALWATAFYGGLRRGELRALRAENVDMEANIIQVVAGWDDQEGEILPKSERGKRTVPIPAVLREFLADHLTLNGRRGQDFAFGSTASSPFTPKNVRRKANSAWAKENKWREEENEERKKDGRPKLAPLAPITLHEARHTYVTLMFYAGLSLERIGDYVGHSSTYMTDRYRHLLKGHEKEAWDMLDAFLALANTAARVNQLDAD